MATLTEPGREVLTVIARMRAAPGREDELRPAPDALLDGDGVSVHRLTRIA